MKTISSLVEREPQEPDAFEQYLAEIGAIPLLSSEEEQRLAQRMRQGDAHAKRQFIEANLRLVVHVAKHCQPQGRDVLDLIQDGNLGLIRAIDRFDPTKGYRFSTYATWWIRQAIQRGGEQTAHLVRLPSYLFVRTGRMAQTVEQFSEEQGRLPTDEQLAAAMDLSVATIGHMRMATRSVLSLDRTVSAHSEMTLGDLLPDERIPACDDLLCQQEEQQHERPQQVQQMLACLTKREAQVLRLRFGLDGGVQHQGYAQIGRELGICRERVRQLYRSALAKLQRIGAADTRGTN